LERDVNFQLSDKVSQNILYRLAKEFYGYTGDNDELKMMEYYSESQGNVHGLYYKDGRYINDDRAIDKSFDLSFLDDVSLSESEVDNYVHKVLKNFYGDRNWATMILGVPTLYTVKPRKAMIDTPTETIDVSLIGEFESEFRTIVQEELSAKTVEKKAEVWKEISDFVQNFSREGGYIELPYYLVLSAKKAGLGDLEKVQLSWKDRKVAIAGQVHDLRAIGDLPIEKEYVEQVRQHFTPEEMQYINLVESAHCQLESLRSIE
jgi:hypothetical protein